MRFATLLTFEEVFPGDPILEIGDYLSGVDKHLLFKVAATFARKSAHLEGSDEILDAFQMIFGPTNETTATELINQIRIIEEQDQKRSFYNPISSLELIEEALKLTNDEDPKTEQEAEVSVFKAYLAINSKWVKKQWNGFETTKEFDNPEELHLKVFSTMYPDHDKVNYNIQDQWITQLLKSVYFFQFLEGIPKAQNLLTAFLQKFNIPNWNEYIKRYLPMVNNIVLSKNDNHSIINIDPNSPEFESIRSLMSNMNLSTEQNTGDEDFLAIRNSPFVELQDGQYLILFDLFAVEKVFKGLYFLLRDLNKDLGDNRCPNFRRLFTKDFSEETLLYKVLEPLYSSGAIKITGKQFEESNIDAGPDYYIRKGKNVLLFESKDVLIRKEDKMSYDYDIYDDVLFEKFYEEEDKKGKKSDEAILQIIGNIRRLLKKEFAADKDYHYRDLKIYPILILHDHQYDALGLNAWLDDWFNEELEVLKEEGLYVRKVQPLTIINIDALILHSEALKSKVSLHEMIDLYTKFKRFDFKKSYPNFEEAKQTRFSKLHPFSWFIDDYLRKNGLYVQAPILDIVKEALFRDEEK